MEQIGIRETHDNKYKCKNAEFLTQWNPLPQTKGQIIGGLFSVCVTACCGLRDGLNGSGSLVTHQGISTFCSKTIAV